MVRPKRHAVDIRHLAHPGEYQHGLEAGLEARQNIGAQVVADDEGVVGVGFHPVERRTDDPGARLAHVKRLLAGHPLNGGTQGATGRVHQGAVGIRVGGDEAGTLIHELGTLLHHGPVVVAGLAHHHEVGVDVGDGETGLVEFVSQGPFADHIGLLAILALEKVGGPHGGGVEALFRHLDPGGAEAILQIFLGLGRVVGEEQQLAALLQQAMNEAIGAGDEVVVVQDDTVDVTDDVLLHENSL